MNHHYPDNYHGYVRGTPGGPGMQNMGYSHGVYEDQMTMGQMNHPRANYQMSQFGDSRQMHPMMHQQPQNNMYSSGGYAGMNQMGGNSYGMGGYSYGMANPTGMNPSPSMMMGPRGNVMAGYYNHPMDSRSSHQAAAGSPNAATFSQSASSNAPAHCPSRMNHMPQPASSQNCSPSQAAGPMPVQTPQHCSSPHGIPQAHSNSGLHGPETTAGNPALMAGGLQAEPRPPVAAARPAGPGMHAIPQHPMRHPVTQQNPQEVADNILQIASSYPTNQTVQVPLKGRHAPYHIPRSPHYSVSSSDHGHSSPLTSYPQQTSPAPQPSPTPSTSSVKSPTPSLAPIPNPIPSPGITALRSPCNQGALASGNQRSPAHVAASYSGHCQPSQSPHFSPSSMGNQPNFTSFTPSPTTHRNTAPSSYPQAHDSNLYSSPDHQNFNQSYSSPHSSSASPHAQNLMLSDCSSSNMQFSQQDKGNNPLMSLQKLVMLPETQVVDPKSVVNDACLSSQSNENEEAPKNGDDPAEGCVGSSDSSVGSSGHSSSLGSQSTGAMDSNMPSTEQSQLDLQPSGSTIVATASFGIGDEPSVDENLEHKIVESNSQSYVDPADHASVQHMAEVTECSDQHKIAKSSKDPEEDSSVMDCESLSQNGMTSSLDTDNASVNDFTVVKECNSQVKRHEDVLVLQSASDLNSGNGGVDNYVNSSFGDESKMDCDLESKANSPKCSAENKSKNEAEQFSCEAFSSPTCVKSESEIKPDVVSIPSSDLSLADQLTDSTLHSLKHKNGKVNGLSDDVKQSLQCRPSGILSEVPLLVNGLSAADGVSESSNDPDSDCNVTKLQNGFSSTRLRSKLRLGEKAGQFVRLTTPCSIAVGADERALCERFVFRRNEYCHTLRTSRLLCNGRTRQDSTGNGDSDESIENISDGSFHTLGNPQDGCKKKASSTSAKKNDSRSSTVHSNSQVPKRGGLATQTGRIRNGHLSNSNGRSAEASDDDGDVCYYEGVDSSDFFMSNVSSDESIPSSQEVKQTSPNNSPTSTDKKHLNPTPDSVKSKTAQEEEVEHLNMNISSPPSKRTRRLSGPNVQEPVKSALSSPSPCITRGSATKSDISCQSDMTKLTSKDQSSSQASNHENGKITRSRASRRKSSPVANERLALCEQNKLSEVVVRLEKSPVKVESVGPAVKIERVDPIVIDDSSPEKCEEQPYIKSENSSNIMADNTSVLKDYNQPSTLAHTAVNECVDKRIDNAIKTETIDSEKAGISSSVKSPSKRTPTPKKKNSSRKGKKKVPVYENRNRSDEVKDSFKSMKFSRTLDMIKNQRKRDSIHTGPFIRVEGSRDAPKTVSVFNQSAVDSIPVAIKQKHNHKQSHSRSVCATVHIVTNLSNDKPAIVSSTKFIHSQQWSCAFCSHHSSFQSLGDLFGPYFKESDLPTVESIALEESKKGEPSKESPNSSKCNITPSKQSKASPADRKGSRKRKLSGKGESSYPQEIWLHESCALWAPGVFLIGNRIYGLDDAIRDTADSMCSMCKAKGAMIGCLYKGCAMKYHFACAMEEECHLDEENFSLLCPKHVDKKLNAASSSSSSTHKKS